MKFILANVIIANIEIMRHDPLTSDINGFVDTKS